MEGWRGRKGDRDIPSKVLTAVLRFIGCRFAATAVMVRNCSSKGYLRREGGREEGGRDG